MNFFKIQSGFAIFLNLSVKTPVTKLLNPKANCTYFTISFISVMMLHFSLKKVLPHFKGLVQMTTWKPLRWENSSKAESLNKEITKQTFSVKTEKSNNCTVYISIAAEQKISKAKYQTALTPSNHISLQTSMPLKNKPKKYHAALKSMLSTTNPFSITFGVSSTLQFISFIKSDLQSHDVDQQRQQTLQSLQAADITRSGRFGPHRAGTWPWVRPVCDTLGWSLWYHHHRQTQSLHLWPLPNESIPKAVCAHLKYRHRTVITGLICSLMHNKLYLLIQLSYISLFMRIGRSVFWKWCHFK